MAATDQPHIFLWAQKLKSEIIQLLQLLFPRTGDMQVNFSEVSLKFKMAAMNKLRVSLILIWRCVKIIPAFPIFDMVVNN